MDRLVSVGVQRVGPSQPSGPTHTNKLHVTNKLDELLHHMLSRTKTTLSLLEALNKNTRKISKCFGV